MTEALITQGADAPADDIEVIENFLISEIDDSERMRPSDPVWVEAIASSMAKSKQLSPIDVCQMPGKKGVKLVYGGHRIDAAKLLGWTHIKGVRRSANALERKSREIAENFFRVGLSPIDEARFVAELIATEKARLGIDVDQDGRALNRVLSKKHQKIQLGDDLCIMHKSLGLQELVAQRLGLNQASVSRLLTVDSLPRSIVERVRPLAIAGNAAALRKLAGLETDRQAMVLYLIEGGKAKGVNDALDILNKKVPASPAKKRHEAFISIFGRMGLDDRKAALRELARRQMPKGYAIVCPVELAPDLTPAEKAQHADIMAMVRSAAAPVPAGDERPDDVVDIEEMLARGAAE